MRSEACGPGTACEVCLRNHTIIVQSKNPRFGQEHPRMARTWTLHTVLAVRP